MTDPGSNVVLAISYRLRYIPSMTRISDIGATLVTARRAAGITQAELGRHLGVAQPQVARWEAAEYRNVSLERVSLVAEALGVDSPDLLPLTAETPALYAPPASASRTR